MSKGRRERERDRGSVKKDGERVGGWWDGGDGTGSSDLNIWSPLTGIKVETLL